jgi:hypothetical protein
MPDTPPLRRRYGIALCCSVVACLISAAAQADDAAPARPRYLDLRFDENWSVLKGREDAPGGDFFDPIKFIPLNESGSLWLSFGAQLRERIEIWNEFGFGGPPGQGHDDTYLLQRALFHADLHLTPWLRVFAQGKSAFVTPGRDLPGGNRKLDVDQIDLQNGFADVMFPAVGGVQLTLRGGRQEMAFGTQRLVSPLDWSNTRRTFDGASAIVSALGWQATGFWTRPVVVNRYSLNDWGPKDEFYGIYASGPAGGKDIRTDLYWLGFHTDNATWNGTTGDEKRQTLGGRIHGVLPGTPLDFDVEGAYQLGEVGPGDINAWMVASQLGWWFESLPISPRFFVGLDWASGDESPGGDVETFNQLFPLSHQYYGWIDAIARQNAVDASLGVVVRPLPALTATLWGHHFWRAEDDDALYNASGAVSRPGSGGSSSWLGAEIDLLLKYQFDVHLAGLGGYSHYFAGTCIEQSGRGRDIDFGYLIFQYTF